MSGPTYGRDLMTAELQKQLAPIQSRIKNKFGGNFDIDTASVPEIIWTVGGMYSWPSTATAMEIYSTSTADRSPSTGARSITVEGLGSSAGEEQSETVALNGQSAVNLVNSYYRVNRMYLATVGSQEENIGTITVRTQGGGTTHCNIRANEGQTLVGHWTVPGGKSARIRKIWAQFPDATQVSKTQLRLRFRTPGFGILTKHIFTLDTTVPEYAFEWPIGGPVASALADIYIDCTSVASNNTQISAGFDLSLEDA